MSSARKFQVPNTTGDTQYNVHDAALRGASKAFSKPPVKNPQTNTYTGGNNGALLAATKAGTGTPRSTTPGTASPLRRDGTDGSSSTLGVPDNHLSDRTPSPSNIAAKLAAARYSPRKPLPHVSSTSNLSERDMLPPEGSVGHVLARLDFKHPTQPPQPRQTRGRGSGTLSTATTIRAPAKDDKATDDTPIPPTTSLVNMFEQNRPNTPSISAEPHHVSQKSPLPVRSPKPRRTFALPPEPKDGAQERKRAQLPPPVKPKPQVDLIPVAVDGSKDQPSFNTLRKDTFGVPPARKKPAQLAGNKTPSLHSKMPSQRGHRQTQSLSQDLSLSTSFHTRVSNSMDSNGNASSPSSFVSAPEEQEAERPKPSLPPPRRTGRSKPIAAPAEMRPKSSYTPNPPTLSHATSSISPPEQFSRRRSASANRISPPTNVVFHSNYQRESVKNITKHLTGESLSNAIVGAALASSRNASPAPSLTAAPPLLVRKPHQQYLSPFHPSRSPSPPKSSGKMRTTMRKDKSSDSSEDEGERYKKKGTRVMGMRRKHPNKHHEGTRKRWRDAILDRERKRYEGVWAANKGLHITTLTRPPSRGQDLADPTVDVLSLVTKDIWSRSRLPEHELEEIWSLVDGRAVGRLRREEFVVGMWLIDQRLKGRKLPTKVSQSVWDSVRGLGVRVKIVPK